MTKYSDYGTLSPRYVEEIAYQRSVSEARTRFGLPANLPEFAVIHAAMAEIFASGTPPANILAFGAVGDGVHDDTQSLVDALASNDYVVIPLAPVAWVFSSVTVGANKTIYTAGINTVIQQKAGQPAATHIFNITGSNVALGDMTVKGNIATDTDEQQHAIFVRGAAAIHNIAIGNINAQDIRGDVVYLGGLGANTVRSVAVGAVYGSNIYRNVITVAGAEDVDIRSITGDNVGLDIFDIEPNPGSAPCRNIRVGYIRGSAFTVAGDPAVILSGIEIGFVDMDSTFQGNSTPAYALNQVFVAMQARNVRGLRVKHFKANNYRDHAFKYIKSGSDVTGQNIIFDYVDWVNCSTTESSFHASALVAAIDNFTINSGTVTPYDVNKHIVFGDSSNPLNVRVLIKDVTCNGGIAKWVGRSEFDGIKCNSALDLYAFLHVLNSTVRNSDITLGRLAGFCTHMEFHNVTAVLATLIFDGANIDHFIENSTINTIYYAAGPNLRQWQNAFRHGTNYVWTDANGRLRLKTSAPTTDLDGSPVNSPAVSTDKGDADATLAVTDAFGTFRWSTPLTAPRTATLSTTSAKSGDTIDVVREAAATGASVLNVGTGPLKALAVGQWARVRFDGAAWRLVAFGAL